MNVLWIQVHIDIFFLAEIFRSVMGKQSKSLTRNQVRM